MIAFIILLICMTLIPQYLTMLGDLYYGDYIDKKSKFKKDLIPFIFYKRMFKKMIEQVRKL